MKLIEKARKLWSYRKEKARTQGILLSYVIMCQIILDNFDSYIRRREYQRRRIPSVLLITLPKSGSMYILSTLTDQCGLRSVITGDHGFPFAPIHSAQMEKFSLGCAVDQGHYMPSVKNLTLLKKHHINKIVVHFRDPRSALVSLVHYFDKQQYEQGRVFCDQDIDFPVDYFEKSFEEKICVAIDLYYLWFIAFIDHWLAYGREGVPRYGIDVLFTEFRKMRNDPDAFFEEITRFYGISQIVRQRHVGKLGGGGDLHYRKGEEEEWRQALTPDQIEKTSAMITDEMAERFGWSKS